MPLIYFSDFNRGAGNYPKKSSIPHFLPHINISPQVQPRSSDTGTTLRELLLLRGLLGHIVLLKLLVLAVVGHAEGPNITHNIFFSPLL